MSKKDEFFRIYNEVIDENGCVKLCGREKCKDLIIMCMALANNTDNYFGDVNTGILNVPNVLKFKSIIENE